MSQDKKNGQAGTDKQPGPVKITDRIDFDQMDAIESSGHRQLGGWLGRAVAAWAIFTAAFHIGVLVFHPLDPWLFRNYHLVLLGVLGFILIPGWGKDRNRVHWIDWILVVLLLFVGWYIHTNYYALIWRAGVVPTTTDYYVALIGVVLVLELVRRASGYALPLLCAVFMAYAFLGPYLPGMLHHRGYSPERFFTYIYGLDGVFSVPLAISSKYIILFIIFGAFLQVSGVGRYFVKWAFAVSGHARGGPAKVAVIASALMGTMNGTSAGNAVATGSFTIPLMRKVGYTRRFAAATEAVASTGGQIMPPVMGAGIFIMAEMTGIPLKQLILAGIIPAVLYFISVYYMVDLEAVKLKLVGFPRELLPRFWSVMKQGYLFLPILALFCMLLLGYSVVMAGFIAIVSSLVVSWFGNRMFLKTVALGWLGVLGVGLFLTWSEADYGSFVLNPRYAGALYLVGLLWGWHYVRAWSVRAWSGPVGYLLTAVFVATIGWAAGLIIGLVRVIAYCFDDAGLSRWFKGLVNERRFDRWPLPGWAGQLLSRPSAAPESDKQTTLGMGPGKVLLALETGAKNAIQLMAVCAGAGIIMGVIALTGVGMKFASVILGIAGTSEFVALVLAMGIAILLGMGLPTTAAYAVAASVVAPGLIQMGIQPLVAHFFVFYFACVSAITPPVALASYAASGISGSDPMKTAVTSFRLGIAAYIVPFMFFYAPEILLQGRMLDMILPALTAGIGVIGLACSVQRFYFGRLSLPVTAVLFAASISLVSPNVWMDAVGLGVMGVLLAYQKFYRGREGQAPGAPAAAG